VGQAYNAWLYLGIVANALMCIRIVRYMRIHAGLHAFYRVFIIAAREFADFAVFLIYILLLLGSAIFAFFQITGGNNQFLRFTDGLSMMTELTFGFASYEEFQNGGELRVQPGVHMGVATNRQGVLLECDPIRSGGARW
jgi:hypothetical protein